MAKAKQGEYYSCADCGLVVVVDEVCGCAEAAIVCCERPMARGKLAASRAKKKAAAKTVASSTAKPKKAVAAPKKSAKTSKAKAPAKKAAKKAAKK